MIPRPQHFGDRAPFPCYRPGIVRIFQETLLEALLLSAGGRAHYPGEQPYASIEDDHCTQLAARQDIVTDGHRFEPPCLEDSLVEPLEAPAQQDDSLARRKFPNTRLRQRGATRRQREHRAPVRDTVERGGEHVRPKHHPRPTARRRVIDAPMLVGREITNV